MKRLVFAAIGLALAAQPSVAADLSRAPVVKAPAAVAAPMFNWSGCYAGAHVGGLRGEIDRSSTDPNPVYSSDISISSATAGGHLGCNYQAGQFVLGIEGDLNWADVSGDEALTNQILFLDFFDHGFDWYGTVRGRVGYAVDRWHLFATAGVAFSDIEMTYSFVSIGGDGGGTASSRTGWVAGAGLEYAWSPNWIGRLEYLYHRFEREDVFNGDFLRGRPEFHVVRVGLTYKFATGKGPAPVVTKY